MEKFKNGNGNIAWNTDLAPEKSGRKDAILLKAVLDVDGHFVAKFGGFIAFNVMNMYQITDKK